MQGEACFQHQIDWSKATARRGQPEGWINARRKEEEEEEEEDKIALDGIKMGFTRSREAAKKRSREEKKKRRRKEEKKKRRRNRK